MRLKRYFDFIKESVEEKSMWRHNDDDFKWYLTEFKDNGYTIDFHRMFINEISENVGSWSNPQYKTRDAISDILVDDSCECYVIQITETPDAPGGDISEALYFAKAAIESELDMNCEIMLNDTNSYDWKEYRPIGGESVKVDGGEITRQLSTRVEDVEEFTDVCIVCWYTDKIKFTGEQFLEYYGWDKDWKSYDGKPGVKISEKGSVYVRIDQEDLSGIIDWDRSEVSSDSLLSGVEIEMYHSDYVIDGDSLIRYHLNDDAMRALARWLIKEAGGLEPFLAEVQTDLDLEGLTEEQVVDEIVGERFERTLVSAAEAFGGDTFDEIRRDWQSWSDQSQADQYDDAVQAAFDVKLDDVFWFEKEEYRSEFKGGNGKWYNIFFYWILIDEKFLMDLHNNHDYELDDIKRLGLSGLPLEWLQKEVETSRIYVRDQYGDVDTDDFSKEIISQYLS